MRALTLVTGGTKGIGLSITKGLERRGIAYITCGRDIQALQQTGAEFSIATDLSTTSGVRELIKKTLEYCQKNNCWISALVNNAGVVENGRLENASDGSWERMMTVNSYAPFALCRAFIPTMKKNDFGRIVNVASLAGLQGYNYSSIYCASKHALVGLTRGLNHELETTNIVVSAVCPGFVDTPMLQSAALRLSESKRISLSQAMSHFASQNDEGKLTKTSEVTEVVMRCLGDSAQAGVQVVRPHVRFADSPSQGRGKGFSHAAISTGRWCSVAGQVGVEAGPGLVAQFKLALQRNLEMVRQQGGGPHNIVSLIVYVTDMDNYRNNLEGLGRAFRESMLGFYPPMALVETTNLVDIGAVVEIQSAAVL